MSTTHFIHHTLAETRWQNSGRLLLQPRLEPALEPGREFGLRHEELAIFDAHPAEAVGRESAAGHQQVNMRMVTQIARPGLQHRGQAQFGSEMFGLGGEVLQRARAFLEQRAIPGLHGRANGFAQFFGHGERHQKIRHGQQPGALLRQPRRRVVAATAGTGAMVARMIGEMFLAADTAVALPAQRRRPAPQDGPHGGALFFRDQPSELRKIRRPVRGQDLRQPHATARCNTSSAVRVRASLSGVRWV